MNLPTPDGRDAHSGCVWWRLSSGEPLFSTNGEVYTMHDPVCSLDAVEFDALAAVAWARNPQNSPTGDLPDEGSPIRVT